MRYTRLNLNKKYVIYRSIHEIAPEDWALQSNDLPVPMNYDYLAMLEAAHKKEIDFFYVLVQQASRTVGVLYFQLINFKGAYVKNFFRTEVERGWFKNLFLKFFYWVLDFMNWKLLSSGNIYFTGETGIYFDETVSTEEAAKCIDEVYLAVHKKYGKRITAYMLNNAYDNGDDAIHAYMKRRPYAAYPVDPDMVMELNPNWKSFDDYGKSLLSKYRRRMKDVYKKSVDVEFRKLENGAIAEANEQLYRLYRNTAEKVNLNLGFLAPDYFIKMNELFGDDFFIMAYYYKGKIVGFMSVLNEDGLLDINYMGLDYTVNRDLKLYNRMLLDLVELAIQMQSTAIHLGRTATEIKSTIGATSLPMHIYLSSPNKLLDRGMRFFEPYFGSPSYTLRQPFKKEN